jgi:hypothetical protein
MPRKPQQPEITQQEKAHARYLTRKLVEDGEIDVPGVCFVCGAEPAECHHIDYNDPSRVMWLCHACHSAYHSQFGKPAPVDWMADIRTAMKRIDAARASLRAARSRDQEREGSD